MRNRLSRHDSKILREYKAIDRSDDIGAGASWLGWQKVDVAISAFLDAASKSADTLDGLSIAEPIVAWLRVEVPTQMAEYAKWLTEAQDDLIAATEVIANLRDEGEYIESLLAFLAESGQMISRAIGEKATPEFQDELISFVSQKLEPVYDSGWNMYHVFIGAA